MRILLVFGVVGRLVRLFSVAFLPPILMAAVTREWETLFHFCVALTATFVCGSLLTACAKIPSVLYRAEAMAIVSGTWFGVAALAGVPYLMAGLPVEDAFFESMSGLTTTGATILEDFSLYNQTFFLWRAMTQWFGGLGVIALFVVILPRLGIAGRQIFFAEASEVSDSISPQIQQSARRLWILYTGLTAFLALLLVLVGWAPYDALLHALTTLSAGGFSPHPGSAGGYASPAGEWILFVFMVLGGTSFTLQWKAFTSKPSAFLRDGEFLFYFAVTVLGGLALALVLSGGVPSWDELRAGAFQSASLISSTGFASVDYDREWSDAAKALLVAIMLVGGCAGSAAGGAKAIRHLLVFKFLKREITQVLHPYSVLSLRHGKRVLPMTVIRAVFTLVVLYLLGYLVIGLVLVVLGSDLVTGFSAALACLGNIGPGFNDAGPMANYAGFPLTSKIVLIIAMWVGRLEIVTVLALLHPHVWRNLRFRGREPKSGLRVGA